MFRNTLILSIALTGLVAATPAAADSRHHRNVRAKTYNHHKVQKSQKNVRKAQQNAYKQGYRDGRQSNNNRRVQVISPNHYPAGKYYNKGRNGYKYSTRPASYDTPYWWGQNGQIYCRRKDGTTGLIVGAVAGGTLGNVIAGHGDKTVGTAIGGVLGGLLGREIERGSTSCR